MARIPRADRHRVNVYELLASVDRRMTNMGVCFEDKQRVMDIVANSCEELVTLNSVRRNLAKGDIVIGSRPRRKLAQWQKDVMETGFTPF